MKKINYLLLVMFAIVLMSTSCEEEETKSLINENQVTEQMLFGSWYWRSLELNDNIYVTCDDYLIEIYDWTSLDLRFSEDRVYMNTKCDYIQDEREVIDAIFEIEDNILKINEKAYVFEILSTPQEIKNGTLILKWIDGYAPRLPIGGIYTLVNY